jgi:hypothetical protein
MDVYNRFRNARFDIREAGNCLAVECGTATVFHLMRTVEWGLRALCQHLGIYKVKSRTKGGKVKFTPIPYVEWETMLNQLHPVVNDRVSKLKRGSLKQAEQEFYYPMLQDIQGIRDAFRNHIMHTRAKYSSTDALAIFERVGRIMVSLARKFSAS